MFHALTRMTVSNLRFGAQHAYFASRERASAPTCAPLQRKRQLFTSICDEQHELFHNDSAKVDMCATHYTQRTKRRLHEQPSKSRVSTPHSSVAITRLTLSTKDQHHRPPALHERRNYKVNLSPLIRRASFAENNTLSLQHFGVTVV